MSPARSEPRRLRRVHLRLAAATALAAGLGGGAVGVLLEDPLETEDPARMSASKAGARATTAPDPSSSSAAPPPRFEAPPPPGRSLEAPAALPPLASRWRKAVLHSRRDQVVAGSRALRASPDGKAQLLSLAVDPNARVRAFAMRELGRRDDPSLTSAFKRALTDSSPYVVENARWALARLEGKK